MDSAERVYPTEEELSKVNKMISCPECVAVFKSESNLTLHLAKTHKQTHLLQTNNSNKIYHCPVVSCNYNNSAHFKQYKFLKQHYLKVHSKKEFICNLCNKGFPTESFRNSHSEYCNVLFKCCDCEMFYGCYETLKTHSRRKKHTILDKIAYKMNKINPDAVLQRRRSDINISTNKMRFLLPKPSTSSGMIMISQTVEQSCQTENSRNTQQNTQETQTPGMKKSHLTVETQTIGDYFSKKCEAASDNKSIKTQTPVISPKTVSCNTSFNLDEFDLTMNEVQRSSSSTQTTLYAPSEDIYSSSTSTHDSIHTDTSDLLTDTFDSNFCNCNMETQTDVMFGNELFKCYDYYSMHTQTCEDLLLGEMEFNNSQTQTVFDDVLRSVESQTIMSQSRTIPFSCKDMSHMETQTDMEFKQMLEEINA